MSQMVAPSLPEPKVVKAEFLGGDGEFHFKCISHTILSPSELASCLSRAAAETAVVTHWGEGLADGQDGAASILKQSTSDHPRGTLIRCEL